MARYLALLRGINVGGRNKVAMADLRALAADLGHVDVATYIQSGNLVFGSGREPGAADTADALADELEREIAGRLNVRPVVVVVPAAELRQIIADNPFPGVADPKQLHAVFRRQDVDGASHAAVAAAVRAVREAGSEDDAVIIGRTLYLSTPGGFGRSDLATRLSRLPVQANGTARNWATVTRLMTMLDENGAG